jgi:VIT1/CCC1 family predicted Fe2+/Mn2+ transporter
MQRPPGPAEQPTRSRPELRRARSSPSGHPERHSIGSVGWLRAVVLGANDGIISVASLVVGIAASGAPPSQILLSGVAATVAGALSMAAGEFVSVQSQADAERADRSKEQRELAEDTEGELAELTQIYVDRGLDPDLAGAVAQQLSHRDPLAAHLRDELGLSESLRARPLQAAAASALSFLLGALLPLFTLLVSPQAHIIALVTITAMVALTLLGGLAASIGGASRRRGSLRMLFWGSLAMGITAAVGRLFGATL